MKKLITAAVASAFAFLAIGAGVLPSGTSLEDLTAGVALDPTKNDDGSGSDSVFWLLTGDENADLLVTNYVAASYEPRPEQFSGANNNFLKIDTTGRLYRSISANDGNVEYFDTVTIKDGIYLDTLVQFTAADDQFKADAIATGDKIAISYVERDADSVDDGETPYTNFVVRAAYVDAANSKIVATNYFLTFPDQPANEVQFDKSAWHRLTVRAISNVGNEYAPVGFVVYVDGTNLVYKAGVSGGSVVAGDEAYVESLNSVVKTYLYKEGNYALLPSLLRYGETGYNTLSAVAFNGNGCVDDISFTATTPDILPKEGMTVTIAWDANVTNCTVVAGETILINETVSGAGSTNLLLAAEITAITVTAGYAEGYEAGAWSASAGTLNNGVWTFENGATLTINSMFPKFEVNGGHYGSFQDALGAAVTASKMTDPWTPVTIKMLSNIDEGVSFSTGNIVLDLNGKTLQGGSSSYYTIRNTGAELAIIDSVSGGKVLKPTKTGSEGSVYTESPLATTIWGGTFDEAIKTQKMDEGDGEDNLILHGGVFADSLYDPSSAESEENQFYLKSYIADSSATYNDGYFTVGSPIIGTYEVTVTPAANATYAAVYNEGGAAVEFVNDVAAVTVGKTITITATPASGYEYADTPTGWTAGQDGKITIEVSAEATVAIPAPTAESSYPSYIPEDAAVKAKYDTWATTYGADVGSAYEAEFLLNVEPGTDKTLEPASITISGTTVTITANKALDKVNGKVYIKTSATLAGLATASWSEATLDASGAIEMTSDGTTAFFKIKVDF